MDKETRVVAWTMESEKCIKLTNPDEVYDIDEKVHKFLMSKELYDNLDDKSVEVKIDTDKKVTDGSHGTVMSLKVVGEKEETPKEEPKQEETTTNTSTDNITVKETVVAGVSVEKRGVKLLEDKENKVWYTLDESIDAEKFKTDCTKKEVQLSVVPQDKGNDLIVAYVVGEEPKKEEKQETKTTSKKSYQNNDVQRSIEAQASVNSANEVVGKMTEILNDPQKVLTTITKIAEHNFKTIQDLKNKE